MTQNTTRAISRQVVIVNELGLHARSAADIAKLAANAKSGVWITKGNDSADAESILDILSLACSKGTKITISIDDPLDLGILNRIVTPVEKGFGE